jgi:AraC-like DNA-binding protein
MDTAIQKISFVLSDKEALHAYHMREMAIMDYNSGMGQAKREVHIEDAIKLTQKGWSIAEIADFTGLSFEEVKKVTKNA